MSRCILAVSFVALFFFSQVGIGFSLGDISVTGKVVFRGLVPTATTQLVKTDEDVCGAHALIQTVQVNRLTLGLRSAVVSIKNAPSISGDTVKTIRVVANTECVFAPRVRAAQVGDVLEIHNLDPILHNTHIKRGEKTFLNVAQVAGSRPISKTLKRTGLHAIGCDKHTFMAGMLLVFDHTYFTVTNEFGEFQLPPLPPGTFRVSVWHETLGTLEKEVTVQSEGSANINFEYH